MNQIKFIVDSDLNFDFAGFGGDEIFFRIDVDEMLARSRVIVSQLPTEDAFDTAFVAGVILSEINRGRSQVVYEHFTKLFPHFRESMVEVFQPDAIDIATWITKSTVAFAKLISVQASRAEHETAEIRSLYSRVQNSLAEVESFQDAPYRSRILLQTLPEKHEIKLSKTPLELPISQEYQCLHAIDVFFVRQKLVVSNAQYEVRLTGAYSRRDLATWRLAETELHEGWNRFYCPIMEEPIAEGIVVSVGTDKDHAQFALRSSARVEWQPDFVTSSGDTIAIRLWSGLLGVKLPRSSPGHFVDAKEMSFSLAAGRSELLQLATAYDPIYEKSVNWDEPRGGLMVHPKGTEPIVAQIPLLQTVDLSTVRVHCKLDHPEASVTEFAIWVRRSDDQTSIKPLGLRQSNGISRLLGGKRPATRAVAIPRNVSWLTLTGGQEGEVSFTVDPAYTGALELYLATRNKTKKNNYAWALFTDIHFEINSSQIGG